MSTLEKAIDLLQRMPESKINTIYAYMCFINAQIEAKDFVYKENEEMNNSFLSEPSLSKDWLREEEDNAWKNHLNHSKIEECVNRVCDIIKGK